MDCFVRGYSGHSNVIPALRYFTEPKGLLPLCKNSFNRPLYVAYLVRLQFQLYPSVLS